MLFDSHAHFPEDPVERAGLIERASAAGVARILAIGGAPDLNQTALAAAALAPDRIRAAVGMDRTQAFGDERDVPRHVADIRAMVDLHKPHVAAIGELGLDYHYDKDCPRTVQGVLFRAMLGLARELVLPVVVHCREAEQDVLTQLTEHAEHWPGSAAGRIGVLHCFTGTAAFAKALVALGYCISFSGIVTFKNAGDLRAVVSTIPDDRLLIETDSPYLAPVPHRGKPNEPAYVRLVAETVAALCGATPEQVAEQTRRNASALFGF